MSGFWKVAGWISRAILIPPIAIFTMVAVRHLTHTQAMAAQQGLVFVSPVGPTIFRAGFAGFPLGCALFFAYCLLSRRRTLDGLIFSALLVGTILIVRIYAMNVDGSVQQSMVLVKDEIVLLLLTAVGVALEVGARAQPQKATNPSSAHLQPSL